ncbi:YpmA family protein [Evansella cellulosilytica]|uniref:DUF4264 domain-containing protein n=1 Tax=Evansella cellulosilytica (strain ATCC 21833 / DSM 2522 / FERM P-1141 / JCM 9156 / N-4) TaxID=649639 RepID=E6TZJ8_EVAC2|nr:YpmA family protein [Evansella cellulosilytica]ADU30172.1 hypothetical protein Bcell_1910 [Evansella cellulosilytica DSM 2522]
MKKKATLAKLCTVTLCRNNELYKVVDSLNRTLKHRDLLFGLSLNKEEQKMELTIYET